MNQQGGVCVCYHRSGHACGARQCPEWVIWHADGRVVPPSLPNVIADVLPKPPGPRNGDTTKPLAPCPPRVAQSFQCAKFRVGQAQGHGHTKGWRGCEDMERRRCVAESQPGAQPRQLFFFSSTPTPDGHTPLPGHSRGSLTFHTVGQGTAPSCCCCQPCCCKPCPQGALAPGAWPREPGPHLGCRCLRPH